uniref:Uncharacterized protein n=1 Tax=Arundo donax TaxID=35708 RepID=A0A0A9EZ32_ARUDO
MPVGGYTEMFFYRVLTFRCRQLANLAGGSWSVDVNLKWNLLVEYSSYLQFLYSFHNFVW